MGPAPSHRHPRATLALVVAALVAALAVPTRRAEAQTPRDSVLAGLHARSHDFDLLHQRIEVGAFDWDSTRFEGRVTTRLAALRPGLDSVVLDAGHRLAIRRVRDAAGTPLHTGSHGDTLVIHLAHPLDFRDSVEFTIEYGGRVDNGRGLAFIQPEGRPHRPRQIWSQGEGTNNHLWFPTYDAPNDKTTWEMVATVPAGDVAVSNGRLLSEKTNADGTRTFDWSQEEPSATYLVSLIVAPLARIHDAWNGKPVDYYVYHADSARAWPLFHVTPDMIEAYSSLTGVPYPWPKYAQTTVADFFGGMENVSATTLVDWLPDAPAYADRPWYRWILIPHELAHQWFGDYVTTEDWANIWLNEGFAEFMPGQYWRLRAGDHAAQDYFLDEYDDFMVADARRRMPIATAGSNVIYPKGALVLEMLRKRLGDDRFWAGVHRYLVDHAFSNATTDDLRQAFLDATGVNLAPFFDQWVYAAGFPAFHVTSDYDAAAHRLTLHVRQTQSAVAAADSDAGATDAGARGGRPGDVAPRAAPAYPTPAAFHTPVDIRVATAQRDTLVHATIDAEEETIVVDGVDDEPRMIVFDEGDRVLKTLTFDQTTPMLANLLARDADLWNRQWAIDQLAQRPHDADAARSLADAATGADYFRTRAAAALALARFPAPLALPALGRAARDTSAQVRAAAVTAAGSVADTAAARLARAALSDSSYQVRAAAVVAVARLERSAAHSVLARALASDSYRDVVREAALQAIAGLDDTTFVAPLAAMIGEDRAVAATLATLAGHGSARALRLLVEHLNDERAYVRRWALTALATRLDPAVATARLEAAEPGLRYDDTRESLRALLERLAHRRPGSG